MHKLGCSCWRPLSPTAWPYNSMLHVNVEYCQRTPISAAGQAGTPSPLLKLSWQSWGRNHRGFTEDTETSRGKEREGSQGKDTFTNRKWSGESPCLAHGTQRYRYDTRTAETKVIIVSHKCLICYDTLIPCGWHLLPYIHIKWCLITSEHAGA